MPGIRLGIVVLAVVLVHGVGLAGPAFADDAPGTYAGKDAHWWVGQLADREGASAARVAFRKIGRPALEPLAEALGSDEPTVRYEAARALKEIRIDLTPIVAQLVAALDSPDPGFQGTVLALVHKTERAALPYIDTVTPLIRSPRPETASAALGVLSRLAPESRVALPDILAIARDGEPKIAHRAIGVAIVIAPDAEEIVPVLAALIGRAKDRDRYRLLQSARTMRADVPGFADLVVACSFDKLPRVRKVAASMLDEIVLHDAGRLERLTSLLSDAEPDVRIAAAHSLAALGTLAGPAVPALMECLSAQDPSSHLAAVRALAAIGADARPAAALVLKTIDRTEPGRELLSAAKAFIASDPTTTIEALGSENERVRTMAFEILASWSPDRWVASMSDAARPVCEALVKRAEPSYFDTRVLDTLGHLASDHVLAQRVILDMARARSPTLRDHAAGLLGARPDSAPLLLELLVSTDADQRAFAFTALERTGVRFAPEQVLPALWPLLHEDRVVVRDMAARLLVTHGGWIDATTLAPRDGEALANAASRLLADPAVRQMAVSRLGQLGVFALPHAEALAALLSEDSLQSVGTNAARALWLIGVHDVEARKHVSALLLAALEGDDPVSAASAAYGLVPRWPQADPVASPPDGTQGHDATLLERLPALIRNPRKTVHFSAVSAAEQMGVRAVPLVPVLVEIVTTPIHGSHVDQWAANALARIAPDDERVVDAILDAVSDVRRKDSLPVFQHALRAGGENAVRKIADALATANAETRVFLLTVLAQFQERASSVRDRVRPLLDDPDSRVATAASTALKALGG